jgi:hypothetical protein
MENGSKTTRPQIHLSTMIILSFTAAILLWANVAKPYPRAPSSRFGWPFEVRWESWQGPSTYGPIFFNLLTSGLILLAAAFVMEMKCIRIRNTCFAFLGIYLLLWTVTASAGVSAVRRHFLETVNHRPPIKEISHSEIQVFIRGYDDDLLVISSPLPFFVTARFIENHRLSRDLERIYFYWWGREPVMYSVIDYFGNERISE